MSERAISRTRHSLETYGYVSRQRDPDNGRAHRVHLTDRALQIGPAVERVYNHVYSVAMKDISMEEFENSFNLFARMSETTARTMSAAWYALGSNPEAASRLHDELDRVLGDRHPTVEDLQRLPYALQVIKEVLRLYPPAPVYIRDAVNADTLDGYEIPEGSAVMMSPYFTHRHPDFWEDPLRFDPDRWTPEREAARHPYAYHPFAVGQRICIGNNFSLLESLMLLALLARRFAPRLAPGYIPQWVMRGVLSTANGLPMVIETH